MMIAPHSPSPHLRLRLFRKVLLLHRSVFLRKTITSTTTVAELDQTEVGEKKKKRKPQYWSAHVDKDSGFVIAGCSLSYPAAQAYVMAGGDVLAIDQSAAYALVKFSGNYVGPETHHGSKGFYLPHYHVRHGGSHVFFLGGITQ